MKNNLDYMDMVGPMVESARYESMSNDLTLRLLDFFAGL